MNEENIKRIIDLTEQGLTQLSDSLGVALPHLWEVLVRQQYVEGIVGLVNTTLFIVLFALWVFSLFKIFKLEEGDLFGIVGGLGAVIFLIWGFVILMGISQTVGKLINPEYYAIQDVIYFIKKL